MIRVEKMFLIYFRMENLYVFLRRIRYECKLLNVGNNWFIFERLLLMNVHIYKTMLQTTRSYID